MGRSLQDEYPRLTQEKGIGLKRLGYRVPGLPEPFGVHVARRWAAHSSMRRPLASTAVLAAQFAYTPAAGTAQAMGPDQLLAVQFAPTDLNYLAATGEVRLSVLYDFSGFLHKVDNMPVVNKTNSGQAIP